MKKNESTYEKSSSKIARIFLPLPNFQYFHKPSEVNEVDSRFIGRENIMKTLRDWLSVKKGNDSGSYLITGYRGMGKSSFVGNVINELIDEQRNKPKEQDPEAEPEKNIKNRLTKHILLYSVIFSVVFALFLYIDLGVPYLTPIVLVLVGMLYVISYTIDINNTEDISLALSRGKYAGVGVVIYLIVSIAFPGLLTGLLTPFWNDLVSQNKWVLSFNKGIDFLIGFLLFAAACIYLYVVELYPLVIENNKKSNEKDEEKQSKNNGKYIHVININLGNEVSGEREILALIANTLKLRFDFFYKERFPYTKFSVFSRSVIIIWISIIAFVIYNFSMGLINAPGCVFLENLPNQSLWGSLFKSINALLIKVREVSCLNVVFGGIFSFCISLLVYKYIVSNLTLYFFKFVGRPLTTPAQIGTKIHSLCERIDSSIDEDNDPYGSLGTSSFSLSLKRKKTRKYQQAGVREIEQELIDIINEIQSSAILNSRFIIVLDELDKIELQSPDKKEGQDNSPLMPEFSFDENGITDYASVNEKKRRVLHLLGQLKYFICTTKAKFVFIAGRELYDAYLADVSDREFSVSSIFNGVINVDSFFSCNSQIKDITKLTETYVCKQLMGSKSELPKQSLDIEKYNIKEFVSQLRSRHPGFSKNERDKIIAFLRQFITYLTFVSNGAPKKLTANFEKYIISEEEYKKQNTFGNHIDTECAAEGNIQYYLAFGYYDQQKIGFIHYMAYPIFENIISPSSEYGDKLLVASSFLIAHIYKHHNSGFSWRNLEYMPELIENHRTPELREYINSIIGYLGKMHLTSIASGIYSYKFPMRLVEEISVFTKKSEEISAIFNFSLDYSNSVKKYYFKLLEYHRKEQNSSPIAMANLHHYLGDIHMSNDEYTEAIVQFRFAVDILNKRMKKCNDNELSSYIVRYTRAMLKLGLAYEKRNTIDSAYMVYSDLTLKLIGHRNFKESQLELHFKTDGAIDEALNLDYNSQGKRILLYKKFDEPTPSDVSKETLYPRNITTKEKRQIRYWIYGDQLIDNLCDFLTPEKSALISKLSVYEDLRLAYLPILAKLFSIEKQNICGITKDNIKIAESEFKYLFLITNSKDKYLLSVDFYRKLGDIIYYKNKHFISCSNTLEYLFTCWGYDIKTDVFDYCYNKNMSKDRIAKIIDFFTKFEIEELDNLYPNASENEKQSAKADECVEYQAFVSNLIEYFKSSNVYKLDEAIKPILNKVPFIIRKRIGSIIGCSKRRRDCKQNFPCFSCRYYNRSLTILKNNLLPQDTNSLASNESKAVKFLKAIKSDTLLSYRHNELTQAALTLDSMGNIMLSCSKRDEVISKEFINNYIIGQNYGTNDCTNLEKAVLYYMVAMEYHYKASNNKEGTNCIVKILNIFSSCIQVSKGFPNSDFKKDSEQEKSDFHEIFVRDIEEMYVARAIEQTYATRDYNIFRKINKFRSDIRSESSNNDKFNLGLTSIMPDIEEVLLAFYEIKLRLGTMTDIEFSYLYQSPSLTYLRCESLTYNRVTSLLFKVSLNEHMICRLLNEDYDAKDNEIAIKKDVYEKYLNVTNGFKSDNGSDNSNSENEKITQIDKCKKVHEILSHSNKDKVECTNYHEMLEFLISDSILCLLYITDFLSPTIRTTMFTNSFCGGIYRRLYIWLLRKEKLMSLYGNKKLEYGMEEKRFKKSLCENTESYSRNVLRTTYLSEMANMFYNNAMEIHNEGQSYQNFIQGFYILDDDLQNNTCQFYLALERYKINIGNLKNDRIKIKNKGYYSAKTYFEWVDGNTQESPTVDSKDA